MAITVALLVAAAVGTWNCLSLPHIAMPARRAKSRDAAMDFIAVIATLEDELHAGASVGSALSQARHTSPLHDSGMRNDEDGPDWLSRAAHVHGLPELDQLALALSLAARTGAGVDSTVAHITASLQSRIVSRALVAQEMAGTKATIAVLAALPVFGAVMAGMLGAGGLQWLVGTTPGRACAVVGMVLEVGGMAWVRRLLRGVEQ